MKILFLDDDPVRHRIFRASIEPPFPLWHRIGCWRKRKIAPMFQNHCVFEIVTAIEVLQNEARLDIAFLDHDLNGQIYVEERVGTGTEVAEFIAGMTPRARPKLVVVHSLNPQGAARMMDILKSSGCHAQALPFGSLGFRAALPCPPR